MSGTCTGSFVLYRSLDALPDDALPLFNTAETVFSSLAWWRTVLTHAIAPGADACFVLCLIDGKPAGLFPMLRGGSVSLTTPYTCLYAPLVAPGADVVRVFATFGQFCRGRGMTRLDCVAAEWPHWAAMEQGLRAAGLFARRFKHFGNWYEEVRGQDWSAWLARRPGALRETIRRRLRRAERLQDAIFRIYFGGEDLEEGIAAFELVYAKSWKDPEPFPSFNGAFMRAMASSGILRLGIWSIGGRPIAAQYWIVEGGSATVLKLAHDEAFKEHSPGTVLTALMLRHLLDREGIAEIDFGRGDDAYKRDWAALRRERLGLLILDPRRPSGLYALFRHEAGRVWQRWRSRVQTSEYRASDEAEGKQGKAKR